MDRQQVLENLAGENVAVFQLWYRYDANDGGTSRSCTPDGFSLHKDMHSHESFIQRQRAQFGDKEPDSVGFPVCRPYEVKVSDELSTRLESVDGLLFEDSQFVDEFLPPEGYYGREESLIDYFHGRAPFGYFVDFVCHRSWLNRLVPLANEN